MLLSTEKMIRNDVASCSISDILIYCMCVKCFYEVYIRSILSFFSDTNGKIINLSIAEVITTMMYLSTAS